MLVAGKLMAATISAVFLGTAGTAIWLNVSAPPLLRDLTTDNDFQDTYKDKYASVYAKYFIGVDNTKTESNKDIDIDKWWEWSFKYKYSLINQEDIKTKFQNKKTWTELKEACKDSYKADPNQVKKETTSDNEYSETDIWTFCSIGGYKPFPIGDSFIRSFSSNSYINDEIGKKYLISAWGTGNSWFWKIKEKEFIEADVNTLQERSSFRRQKSLGFFSFLARHVKSICKRAYWKDKTSTSDEYPKEEIYRFCSLEGKEPTIPTPDKPK